MSSTARNERGVAASLHAMLTGLIDYAGLFPPAGLDMPAAVENYARYHEGEHAELLARFIVPASRLGEFEFAANSRVSGAAWHLSVLITDVARDMPAIAEFNQRAAGKFVVDTVELKAGSLEEVLHSRVLIHHSITPYFEIAPASVPALLPVILRVSGRVKIRTGGITANVFPSSEVVADFIRECVHFEVAFKATAGLHHPVRCLRPLTYAPNAPTGMMHGFLNVFVASALARQGADRSQLVEVLQCEDANEFRFGDVGLTRRDLSASVADIAAARDLLAISFGSCSFEEPVADLQQLGLL